jgi:hypothetical protein
MLKACYGDEITIINSHDPNHFDAPFRADSQRRASTNRPSSVLFDLATAQLR